MVGSETEVGKEFTYNAEDMDSSPESGIFSGGGSGNPLQPKSILPTVFVNKVLLANSLPSGLFNMVPFSA